jgi:hypothetical protein
VIIMAVVGVRAALTPDYLGGLIGSAIAGGAFTAAFHSNATGLSGPGFGMEAAALTSRRTLRAYFAGQNLAVGAIAVPLVAAVTFGLAAMAKHPAGGFAGLAVGLAVVFTPSVPAAVRLPVLVLGGAAYGLGLAWAGVRAAAILAEQKLPELAQVAIQGTLLGEDLSAAGALGGQAFAAQGLDQFLLARVDRRQRADHPAEQQVGQAGVAHQRRAVQVGADHAARVRALGAVAVADAGQHGGQRLDLRAAPGVALVVLEAGEPLDTEGRIDVGGDLPDPAALSPAAADVEQAQARDRLAIGPAELGADDLVAGAHGQQYRPAVDRRAQPAAGPEPARGQHLRQVLAAAHQVDVAVDRDLLVGVDLGDLDREAAQPGPAGQHEQVPAITVRAEQVRVDPDQPDR